MKHNDDMLNAAIAVERIDCRCEERVGIDEDGEYPCDGLCEGCRNYESADARCDIYENVRVALEEDAQAERLGIDDYT